MVALDLTKSDSTCFKNTQFSPIIGLFYRKDYKSDCHQICHPTCPLGCFFCLQMENMLYDYYKWINKIERNMPRIKNQKVLYDISNGQPVNAFFAHCEIIAISSFKMDAIKEKEMNQIFYRIQALKTSVRNKRPLNENNILANCLVPQAYYTHKEIRNSGEITAGNIIYVYFPKDFGNNKYWHLVSPAGFESSKTGIFYPMWDKNLVLKTFEEIEILSR